MKKCKLCGKRGGHLHGEAHPNAKLKNSEVRRIRRLTRATDTELADEYGVSRSHIGNIRAYRFRVYA